jgi:hypothetical protein
MEKLSAMAPTNHTTTLALEFAAYCYGAAEQCLPGYNREYFLWRARQWEEHARTAHTEEKPVVGSPALSPA